jgi:hypothetical protein
VCREVSFQLRFLGVSLVEELDELGVTSVELGHVITPFGYEFGVDTIWCNTQSHTPVMAE